MGLKNATSYPKSNVDIRDTKFSDQPISDALKRTSNEPVESRIPGADRLIPGIGH